MSFDPDAEYARCSQCKEELATHVERDEDGNLVLEIEPCRNCCVEC